MNKLSTEVLVAIMSGVTSILVILSQALVEYVKRIKHTQKEGVSEDFTLAKLELQAKAHALREKIDCQRVSVCLFHNGGNYFTGESIKKMSIVVEVVDNESTTKPTKNEVQNVPIADYIRNIYPLFNQDFVFEKNTSKVGDTLSLIHESLNIKSCLIFPIFKKKYWWAIRPKKRLVAILYIGWDIEQSELDLEDLQLIKHYSATINDDLVNLAFNR